MTGKYVFNLASQEKRRALPGKIIIGQQETETVAHVLLKLLGFVFFHRERLQMEVNLHMDSIPFVPDLVQLDYELRPCLWVECGDCGVNKLNKLAVKVPEAEIWVVKRSLAEAELLLVDMAKHDLRRDRYNLLAFDQEMFDEMCTMAHTRNELTWFGAQSDPPAMQFEFNGLWFDAPFTVLRF